MHGNTGQRGKLGIGKRYTKQGRHKQAQEDELLRRILIGLRRLRFDAYDATERDATGVRINGLSAVASCGDYFIYLAVVVPGRKPDALQLKAKEATPGLCFVSNAPQAVALASLGLVSCDAYGRLTGQAIPRRKSNVAKALSVDA